MHRVFSGIQPSGELHIGNFLGAVTSWVALQDQFECIYSIVDLHAITQPYDTATLAPRTLEMAVGLLASGLDPSRCTLFVQSQVPQHAELMWLLNTVTPLGELERMTQFKDKSARQESVPAGLLNYPVLQAADILLYKADRVPVGEDQLQHLELAREIARRWNTRFGVETFAEPQPLLSPTRRILGLDGQAKMSKSLGNTIGLLESAEEIWAKLRPSVTDPARQRKKDPGNPEVCNLFTLHRAFSTAEQVADVDAKCRGAGWGCLDCKRLLADNMIAALAPVRERAAELRGQPERVREILGDGAARCRAIAEATMVEARGVMGLAAP
jgi:tryptophanyl-tRNA synthetase